MIIGAHIKRKKTIVATFEDLRKHSGDGPTALQIFVANPRSGRITDDNIQKYKEEATTTGLKEYMRINRCRLWIHGPYTFNIARPFAPDAYWVIGIIKHIQLADVLGADGVVIHVGQVLNDAMKTTIGFILRNYSGSVKLALETASGTDVRLLRDFVHGLADKRLKLCIDTAHVWAAGYDPTEAIRFIGRNILAVVHLNNTPKPFGSRIDRHECAQSTSAKIPMNTMRAVAQLCAKWKIPLIMETPRDCWQKEIILFRENRAPNA